MRVKMNPVLCDTVDTVIRSSQSVAWKSLRFNPSLNGYLQNVHTVLGYCVPTTVQNSVKIRSSFVPHRCVTLKSPFILFSGCSSLVYISCNQDALIFDEKYVNIRSFAKNCANKGIIKINFHHYHH